jgi:hypothetical protein
MNIWLDGLSALDNYAWAVFGVYLIVIWGQIVIYKIIPKSFKDSLTDAEALSLSMAGWIVPVMLWAGLYVAVVFLLGKTIAALVSVLIILAPVLVVSVKIWRISLPAITLTLSLAASLILRFAFLKKVILPSYFDSAEHYRIIKYFSETWLAGIAPSAWAGQSYYHAGYHLVSAAFSDFFQVNILDVILVFGQVILAVLPISLFFIVRQETGSNTAGYISVLLAGIGWHMPSHVANWGKYPALLSLVCIHFVLSLGYILVQRQFKEQRSKVFLLIGAGILLSTLIHTRSVFVYAGMAGAVFLTILWKRSPIIVQHIFFGCMLLILAVEISFVQNSPALSPLLNAYLRNDLWMLLLVSALIPFAIKYYADFTFLLFTSLILFVLALFIPIHISGFGVLTLLDRPYVQMLTYLPLSIFGGLGLSGLIQWMRRLFPRSTLPAHLMVISVFGLVIFNASLNHKFYPSDCCQFASRDDLAAITWMDASLPPDASILIASENLYVTSFEQDGTRAGADGGIWIMPLISRQTIPAWQSLDFTQSEIHDEICQRSLDYVYVGGMPQSFDSVQLASQSEWYRVVFALPAARMYQVTGCE